MRRLPLRGDWVPDKALLEVRLAVTEDPARQDVTALLTVQVMNSLLGGGNRLSL
jgi:hypothetical protein